MHKAAEKDKPYLFSMSNEKYYSSVPNIQTSCYKRNITKLYFKEVTQ